jgi:hypothetical protein
MRSRRVLAFLLGAWLMGALANVLFSAQALRSVEVLLENQNHPAVRQMMTLGSTEARTNLSFFMAELTRAGRGSWEWFQLVLVLLIGGQILFSGKIARWMMVITGLLLAGAVAELFVITPETTRLGRLDEFVPATTFLAERPRYYAYVNAYRLVQGLMFACGAVLSIRVLMPDTLRRFLTRSPDRFDDKWEEPQFTTHRR